MCAFRAGMGDAWSARASEPCSPHGTQNATFAGVPPSRGRDGRDQEQGQDQFRATWVMGSEKTKTIANEHMSNELTILKQLDDAQIHLICTDVNDHEYSAR